MLFLVFILLPASKSRLESSFLPRIILAVQNIDWQLNILTCIMQKGKHYSVFS